MRKIEENMAAAIKERREMADMLRNIADGQKITQESVVRLEERVSYLTKGQEEIRLQIIRKPGG